jgi:ParB family transcriptional regulator, chromosome partitioning protein
MNTAAARHLAGEKDKDKEKMEKRRALGRGLASLLPGPRVVTTPPAAPNAVPPIVRNDKAEGDRSDNSVAAGTRAGASAPHSAVEGAASQIPHVVTDGIRSDKIEAAGAAGQSTAVPALSSSTYSTPTSQPTTSIPGSAFNRGASDLSAAAASVRTNEIGDAPIELMGQAESRIPANLVANIAISDIDKNPFQTRYVADDEALEELSDSIKVSGVVQPIMVRPSEEDEGRYILILGERRLHASKKAGKTHIPAMVRRVSLQQAAEMTIVENLQREDLSALEQAEAFRVLSSQFSLTQQQIAERVGLSRASVTNYMRLLKLPREVMQLLAEKRINFAKAKELLKLENDDQISQAALYAVKKGLSLEQVERLVLSMNGLLDPFPGMPGQVVKKTGTGARWVDPNVRAAQTDLERMLGVRVRIRDRKGKGKIVIEYSTVDDYDRVVEMLRGKGH